MGLTAHLLLAIVTVPVRLTVLEPRFPRLDVVDPRTVAVVPGKSFLLPLILGIAGRWLLRDASDRVSDARLNAVGVVFSACALTLLATHWRLIAAIFGWPLPALGGFTLASLGVGHLRNSTRGRRDGHCGGHAGTSHGRADRGLHAGIGPRDHSVHEMARSGDVGRAEKVRLIPSCPEDRSAVPRFSAAGRKMG